MSLKEKITELVLEEDKKIEERLKSVRSRVLATKDFNLIETYFSDLRTLIERYEQEKEEYVIEGKLSRKFFADLNAGNVESLKGRVIHRESESGIIKASIEDVVFMQKDRIPNYEAGVIYIMPYHRKVLNHLFNVAVGEKNAVVYVKQVRIDGKKYGPGQFTATMGIDASFDGQYIDDSKVWIEAR